MRILLDINIILDIALKRDPFREAAKKVLAASNFDRFHLFMSATMATDIYYILRKAVGKSATLVFMRELLNSVDICHVDKKSIFQALGSNFPDFEDAVQYFAALDSGIEMILTRNVGDYLGSSVPVVDPQDFVRDYL